MAGRGTPIINCYRSCIEVTVAFSTLPRVLHTELFDVHHHETAVRLYRTLLGMVGESEQTPELVHRVLGEFEHLVDEWPLGQNASHFAPVSTVQALWWDDMGVGVSLQLPEDPLAGKAQLLWSPGDHTSIVERSWAPYSYQVYDSGSQDQVLSDLIRLSAKVCPKTDHVALTLGMAAWVLYRSWNPIRSSPGAVMDEAHAAAVQSLCDLISESSGTRFGLVEDGYYGYDKRS